MDEPGTTTALSESAFEVRLDGVPQDELVEWLGTMLVIREFEESLESLTASGKIPGSSTRPRGRRRSP
jgi:TPP-dependent pyruvate/acetoin dehydrogenase alpha subunit